MPYHRQYRQMHSPHQSFTPSPPRFRSRLSLRVIARGRRPRGNPFFRPGLPPVPFPDRPAGIVGLLDVKPALRAAHPAPAIVAAMGARDPVLEPSGRSAAGAFSQIFHILSPINLCPNRTRSNTLPGSTLCQPRRSRPRSAAAFRAARRDRLPASNRFGNRQPGQD